MLKNRFFLKCVVAAVAFPLVSLAAVAATAKNASARRSCTCSSASCDKAIANCYLLICADGSSSQCYGKWNKT